MGDKSDPGWHKKDLVVLEGRRKFADGDPRRPSQFPYKVMRYPKGGQGEGKKKVFFGVKKEPVKALNPRPREKSQRGRGTSYPRCRFS